MSLTILPESTQGRLGREMGQAFATGVGKNYPDPQLQQQGRQQQSALAEFEKSLTATDNPADVSMKWAKTMAGVAGADKLQNTVLPQYLKMSAINMGMGGGQFGPQPGQQPEQPGQPQPGQAGEQMQPAADINQGIGQMLAPPGGGGQPLQPPVQPGGQGQQPQQGTGLGGGQGGINPRAMQMSQYLDIPYEKALGMVRGVPEQEVDYKLQQLQLERSKELAEYAQKKLPENTTPDEMNDFVRMGSEYQNMKPEDWYAATDRKFKKYQNVKGQFDKADVPGMWDGILKGGQYRADALKRMENLVKPLVDAGKEDYVRSQLIARGLSQAEVEMLIRPMEKAGLTDMKKLPNSPYRLDEDLISEPFHRMKGDKLTWEQEKGANPQLIEDMNNKYTNYLRENITPNVSILGLREMMRKEKGVDWRHFQELLNDATASGLQLSAEQQGEMGELTKPPQDSIRYIFKDFGNISDYLKGKK